MATMTQEQINAYLAKQFAVQRKDAASTGVPVEDEGLLHNQIICECKLRGWIAFHGSMAHATFRTKGEPDFVLLLPNGRTLLIECKSKNRKSTPEQLAIHAWARTLGHVVHVIRSMEEFYDLTKT